MHCNDEDKECSRTILKAPSLDEFEAYQQKIIEEEGEEAAESKTMVPKCQTCGGNMKPHCMFFDEAYSQHYYRRDTIRSFSYDADCMIVVGTALATGMASQLVNGSLCREIPVIEVNITSSINRGNNI